MGLDILIIDDSATARKAIRKSVGMAPLDIAGVHEAAGGEEAFDVLDAEEIDLILLDFHMDGMNGGEIVDRLIGDETTCQIPIIMISSDRSEDRINELKEKGVHDFIGKPFKPERLADVVKETVGNDV